MGAQIDTELNSDDKDQVLWSELNTPLNGTDARRRLEDKLEEMRLRRELKEFDFEI
jgi:hypothetical protein